MDQPVVEQTVDAELAALIGEAADAEQAEVLQLEVNALPEIKTLLAELRALRDQKTALEEQVKIINKKIEELRAQVVGAMQESGIQNLRVEGVGMAYIQHTVQVTVQDGEALNNWAREHGFGHLVKETIHPQTLKSFVNEQIANGGEIPPDEVVKRYVLTDVRLRRS